MQFFQNLKVRIKVFVILIFQKQKNVLVFSILNLEIGILFILVKFLQPLNLVLDYLRGFRVSDFLKK